jgi:type IV pilus assembly protein PilA
MSQPSQPEGKDGPVLPVIALVVSVVGLCLPPLLLVSFGLGLYVFLKARRDPAWASKKNLGQMAMVISGVGVLVMAGVVVPNVKKFRLRARQIECREVLLRLADAEKKFYEKNSRYTTSLRELDPLATRGRHLIRLAGEGPLWAEGALTDAFVGSGFDTVESPIAPSAQVDAALPKLILNDVGIHGVCPACTITLLCASELDGDATADVWTISTIERLGTNGAKIPGNVPWCEVDDVMQ